MYAIVDIAGQQFKVSKDQKIYVHRLQNEEGSKITFDKVMLLSDKENVTIGTPIIEGVSVSAKVLSHLKGDKVVVFKKKRRKGYQKKNGHRQYLSQIQIEGIATSEQEKEAPKKQAVKKETLKKEDSKKKVAVNSSEEKKETPKKQEVKKETLKKEGSKEKIIKGDDLKKVEGIGPKIAEIFNEAGIVTFSDLAGTSAEKLKEILVAAGSRYASKNPTSWPKQAKMAAEGKWEALNEWQKNVKGGIE